MVWGIPNAIKPKMWFFFFSSSSSAPPLSVSLCKRILKLIYWPLEDSNRSSSSSYLSYTHVFISMCRITLVLRTIWIHLVFRKPIWSLCANSNICGNSHNFELWREIEMFEKSWLPTPFFLLVVWVWIANCKSFHKCVLVYINQYIK